MKKRLLKIIGIILVILIILFIASKIYHFVVFDKTYKAVENFRVEENRYYAVEVTRGEIINYKEEIFLKENVIKYLEDRNLHCEWKNINTNEQYVINIKKKEIYKDDILTHNEKDLASTPQMLLFVNNKNKSKLDKTFAIRYIVPTKYEDKKCYKIVTATEIIIIDRETYLPAYSSRSVINKEKNENDKIEMKYQFEVGNVTEEDVALPDLTDYTVVE